ncbi:MAG: hypothetical protein IKJ27_06675, partial [Clostridia bacterium]|nr:hypothetical protein [Clostridia bacterium]
FTAQLTYMFNEIARYLFTHPERPSPHHYRLLAALRVVRTALTLQGCFSQRMPFYLLQVIATCVKTVNISFLERSLKKYLHFLIKKSNRGRVGTW